MIGQIILLKGVSVYSIPLPIDGGGGMISPMIASAINPCRVSRNVIMVSSFIKMRYQAI